MKVVDLEQQIFVPVVDESKGGVTYEMKMNVGDFFAKCCKGFEPEVVEAIPVKWLREKTNGNNFVIGRAARFMLHAWEQEQGAR